MACAGGMPGSGGAPDARSRAAGANRSRRRHRSRQPAGSVLAGQVNGLAPAAQVRATFGAWQSALVLEDYREHPMSGAAMRLHAAARCGEVTVGLTATVFGEDGGEA